MKVWNQAPLVRLLAPFLIGIICAVYFPFNIKYILIYSVILFVILAGISLVPKFYISYKRSYWFGFLVNISLFIFSYQLTIFNTQKFSPNHFSNYCNGTTLVYARLSDQSIEKEKSLKTIVEILAVNNGEKWKSTSGKAVVYLKKDANGLLLKYGDELLISTNFKEIASPQNPGEFDYKRFLAFHNIYNQAYVGSHDWKNVGQNSGNLFMKYSIALRSSLFDILKLNHLNGDELSVGAALLLGYTDKLDSGLIAAYSSTGALHVLSVSGLHVAIVYIVFSWLLFFLDKNKKTAILKSILLILFLWFYAAITGLSPSVLRAATMFSFIIFAKGFKRHTNIYNTLAASAMFLLLINPFLIMEVGFQLSYLAVIGIVYIQPKIQVWFEFDNWILSQAWTVTSVSIAAQIATCPLALLYFHQFPNYFLLSNLLVIPISTIIIYLGIAVFTFSQIPLVVKYLAIVFTWLIWLLNYSVKWIESLPFSLLQGISISVLETWLIYGLIVMLFIYLASRKYKYLVFSLSFLITILISQIIEQNIEFGQRKIVVYNIPETSAVDFIDSQSNIFLTDSIFASNTSKILFHVKHNWWELGLKETEIVSSNFEYQRIKNNNGFIQFLNSRVLLLKDGIEFKEREKKRLQLDYLIVSGNTKMSIAEIQQLFLVRKVIFDSSNSIYQIRDWEKQCNKLDQAYFTVSTSGAFEVNL